MSFRAITHLIPVLFALLIAQGCTQRNVIRTLPQEKPVPSAECTSDKNSLAGTRYASQKIEFSDPVSGITARTVPCRTHGTWRRPKSSVSPIGNSTGGSAMLCNLRSSIPANRSSLAPGSDQVSATYRDRSARPAPLVAPNTIRCRFPNRRATVNALR